MIDEKKIEEAAFKFGYDNGGSYGIYTKANVIKSFKDGVNWFLGNLWHPASEEPKKDKVALVKAKITYLNDEEDIGYIVASYIENGQFKYWNAISLPDNCVYYEEISYAYIEDLMKGGKDD